MLPSKRHASMHQLTARKWRLENGTRLACIAISIRPRLQNKSLNKRRKCYSQRSQTTGTTSSRLRSRVIRDVELALARARESEQDVIVQRSASGLVTRDEAGSGVGMGEQENKASCTTHCSSNSIDAGLNVGGTAPVTRAPRGASRVYPDSVRTARIGVGVAGGCGTGACERVMCVLSEHGQVRTLSRQRAAWPPCCLSSHNNHCWQDSSHPPTTDTAHCGRDERNPTREATRLSRARGALDKAQGGLAAIDLHHTS
jgi:hypothetical protein